MKSFGRTNSQVPVVLALGARGLVKIQLPGRYTRDSDLAGYGTEAGEHLNEDPLPQAQGF